MIRRYVKGKVKYRQIPQRQEVARKTTKFDLNLRNLAIPSLLVVAGVAIIVSQVAPSAKFYVEQNYSDKYAEILSPLPEDSNIIQQEENFATFEAQYFAELLNQVKETEEGMVAGARVPNGINWNGKFAISIPAVGIEDMTVTANVNSYDETNYDNVLKSSVAHFKGTDLPTGSDYEYDTNTFLYAHSAPSRWATFHKNSFEAAFNPLFDVEIGDEIIINFEDEKFEYKVIRVLVTKPEDMSTLQGIPGAKTLTLMTCAPPGSATSRLNVIAKLVE